MYMPTLANILHYRLVDVTAIKILADKWYPNDVKNLVKQNNHRAACDIKESIKELEYYKKFCFK